MPSTVILTRIVRAVASFVLTLKIGISPPIPLTFKNVLSVAPVITPDRVDIDCPKVVMPAPAVPAIAYLLNSALVAFRWPADGNIDDLKNILKAPLIGAV